jgi:predicted kinase
LTHTIINSDDWYDYLVVDNTNIRITDITPYIRIAQAYKYDVSVSYINTDIEISKSRNVHNVPDSVYEKMQQDFETMISVWPKDFPNIEYIKT